MQLSVDIQLALADPTTVPTQAQTEQWVHAALAQAALERGQAPAEAAELSVRIVGEEESQTLNQRYRDRQGPTNVLSFPAELPPEVCTPLLGDLVICAPLVAREAQAQDKAELAHWAHLLVHGTLHLLGYDHVESDAAQKMEAIEITVMNRLGYPNPYI